MRRILLASFCTLLALGIARDAGAQGTQNSQNAARDTASRPVRRSWTADGRAFFPGDIITVLVDENTLATAVKGQNASDATQRDMGLSADPPNLGAAPLPSIDVKVGTNKRASSRQNADARREQRFRGEMSVRVIAVSPQGLLQVKGSRTVDVDKNKQQMTLTGWVRPQDVMPNNAVESARVADAEILYTLSGALGKTRGGIVSRLISIFWP